jgi:threonine synthase
MGHITGLKCKECGRTWPKEPTAACADCWGPLEASYDLEAAARTFTRETIATRPRDLWRYAELLPLEGEPTVGRGTGFTPLLPAPRLGAAIGVRDLWIKYDAACHPTLSFKDRLVAVALSKAKEFGLDTVGCASTGNLANAVAAGAASAGLRAVVLVPVDLEAAKLTATAVYGATLIGVRGNYDRVNRLCTEIADRFGWGLVNVNLRAYYSEGSKTVGFELAEQGGWELPRHVVCPMAGASLINKVDRAFQQLTELGLVEGRPYSLHGAQATGCAPVVRAWKENLDRLPLVKPSTIVRSLAIGDPADGLAAVATIRRTGGRAEDASDPEVLECMRLLARTEGLFAETAGGTVVAAARKLARAGAFDEGGRVVLLLTGHGLKTVEALSEKPPFSVVIDGRLDEFEEFWAGQGSEGARAHAQA